MKPIRCIECYKNRPGGRCEFCPLHPKNRETFTSLDDGWYQQKTTEQKEKKMDENPNF